jgi:hypothetical protein
MIVAAVIAVVHEQVHQRTCREQQPGQRTEDVSRVLRDQEVAGHAKEPKGNDPDRGSPPGLLLLLL